MADEDVRIPRRRLVSGSLTISAFGLLGAGAACRPDAVKVALTQVSRANDLVQAALFSPHRLAPTYGEAAITRPFPFNAFYPEAFAPEVDASSWSLRVSGRVADTIPWSLARLRTLPQEEQVTRLICIEGWSAVGRWGGVPLHVFLAAIGADRGARYVAFRCADDYTTSIDMASALHTQTIVALTFLGRPLPVPFGFPVRLRIPTKLGLKNAKHIVSLTGNNEFPGGYWEDQGYNWFSGV